MENPRPLSPCAAPAGEKGAPGICCCFVPNTASPTACAFRRTQISRSWLKHVGGVFSIYKSLQKPGRAHSKPGAAASLRCCACVLRGEIPQGHGGRCDGGDSRARASGRVCWCSEALEWGRPDQCCTWPTQTIGTKNNLGAGYQRLLGRVEVTREGGDGQGRRWVGPHLPCCEESADPQSPLWMPLIDATALEGPAMLVMLVVLLRMCLLSLPVTALGGSCLPAPPFPRLSCCCSFWVTAASHLGARSQPREHLCGPAPATPGHMLRVTHSTGGKLDPNASVNTLQGNISQAANPRVAKRASGRLASMPISTHPTAVSCTESDGSQGGELSKDVSREDEGLLFLVC